MENKDNRFILDPRRGSSCKTTCPHCGGKKCFKLYIDTETGEPLGNECGRCDHEQSCGYHYKPREFFQDHPDVKQKLLHKDSFSSFKSSNSRPMSQQVNPKPMPVEKVVYFDMSMVLARHFYDQTFMPWLRSKVMNDDKVNQAFEDYLLGATNSGKFSQQAIIFWYIDCENRVCDGKLMWYGEDGHRTIDPNWVSSQMRKTKRISDNSVTRKCFFGEHLLSLYPDKPVAIVESEKSAVFCSCVYPQFVWLATGGCGGLNAEKMDVLKGRKIVIFPDSGKLDDWRKKLQDVKGIDFRFNDALEAYPNNSDIVDVKLGEVKPMTTSKSTAPTNGDNTQNVDSDSAQNSDVIVADPPSQSVAAEKFAEMRQDYPAVDYLNDLFGLEPLDYCPF